jgi:hypothetical protein
LEINGVCIKIGSFTADLQNQKSCQIVVNKKAFKKFKILKDLHKKLQMLSENKFHILNLPAREKKIKIQNLKPKTLNFSTLFKIPALENMYTEQKTS